MLLLRKVYEGYVWLFVKVADPRADRYFLGRSVFPTIIYAVLYLQLVNKILPKFMKDRPAYSLKTFIGLFNLTQVLINGYIVVYGTREMFSLNWDCAEMDYSESPRALQQLHLTYIYFLTKILDTADTVFFVLRKKTNQLSFLHVYHHFGMIIAGFAGVKFLGGGHSLFLGYLNSFVHVVMYFYYFLTVWDEKYKRLSATFKKQITHLQMFQFSVIFVIYSRLVFKNDCNYPKFISMFLSTQAIYFLFLFGEFYYQAYIKKNRKTKKPVTESQ